MKANIDQLRSLPDYAELIRWNVIFVEPPRAANGFPSTEDLNIRAESATPPKATNEKIEVRHKGLRVYQPGITLPEGTMTLTFNETVTPVIKQALKSWRDAIYDFRSGQGGDKVDCAATIILEQLNKQDKAVWRYTLYGVFLEDYDLGSLDSASSDIQKPSWTLTYDFFTDGAV